MSLQVKHFAFAEGSAFDARGNITLVSFSPQARVVDRFPAQMQHSFVLIIEDDDPENPILASGRIVKFRVSITEDSGQVIFFVEQTLPYPGTGTPGLPPRLQIVAQTPLTASKNGQHTLRVDVEVSNGGEVVGGTTAETSMWVVDQQWVESHQNG